MKPKQLSGITLSSLVSLPKSKACKATGKGPTCSDMEGKRIIKHVRDNMTNLREIGGYSNTLYREQYDLAKQRLLDHSPPSNKVGKLNNDLEVKLSRKSRLFGQEEIKSKDNKDKLRKEGGVVGILERQLKQKE